MDDHVRLAETTVYIARDDAGLALYVGVTNNLQRRLKQHRSGAWRWSAQMASVDAEVYPNRDLALAREAELIVELDPPGNRTNMVRLFPNPLDELVRLRNAGVSARAIQDQLHLSSGNYQSMVHRAIETGRIQRRPAGRRAVPERDHFTSRN